MLDQQEFEILVHNTIMKHPDWISGTIKALEQGAVARVEFEVDKRAEADTALCILLSDEKGKEVLKSLTPVQQKRIKASIEAGSFGGTEWSKSL